MVTAIPRDRGWSGEIFYASRAGFLSGLRIESRDTVYVVGNTDRLKCYCSLPLVTLSNWTFTTRLNGGK